MCVAFNIRCFLVSVLSNIAFPDVFHQKSHCHRLFSVTSIMASIDGCHVAPHPLPDLHTNEGKKERRTISFRKGSSQHRIVLRHC